MRILHTEASLGWGGQEIRILSESAGLIKRGHEVLLTCPAQATIFREAQRFSVPVRDLPIGEKRLPGLLALRKLLASERFDVINESGLKQVPIVSIPTGIDPKRFAPANRIAARARLGLPVKGFYVGIVATLRSWKGHKFLIDAFAKMREPGDRLLIVGDGPVEDALIAQIGLAGLSDSVTLAGKQNTPEDWFPAFDVMCLPSYANEGVPQSLMQAMMCALPCVTCDVGAISEIARDGETALLVEPQNPDAIAAALTRLRNDSAFGETLGGAARQWVLERHSFDRMCDDMEAVFSALAQGQPALSLMKPRN